MKGFLFLLKEEELGLFPSWEKIFGRKAPLYFEIGVGNGEFLIEMAKKFKDADFIGVEVSKEVLRKALSRAEKAGVSNVRLLHLEGTKALAKLFESESLEGVYLNFPDPWPKKKHQKRRIVNPGFLYLLCDRLKRGGFFQMATDHEEYAKEVLNLFKAFEGFSPLWEDYVRKNPQNLFPTKYARKWLSQGKKIYLIGVKKEKKMEFPSWVKDWCPLLKLKKEEVALPIVSIFKSLPKPNFSELAQSLRGELLFKEENTFIKILETFYHERALLMDLLVEEGIIKQRFFVKLIPYEREAYLVSPYDSEKPDPTEGVHLAMVLILKKIKDASEVFELVKSTCKEKYLRRYLLGGKD